MMKRYDRKKLQTVREREREREIERENATRWTDRSKARGRSLAYGSEVLIDTNKISYACMLMCA
jgi:hypothetical protein